MIERTDLQETLKHLERLTHDARDLYPTELPFFDNLAQAGKLEKDLPLGRRHMTIEPIGGLCTRVVTLDLLTEKTRKMHIGTQVDGFLGLVSVGILYQPPEVVKSADTPLLSAMLALTSENEPRVYAQAPKELLHPTLARYGGLELMRWGVRPHFTKTPIQFTARHNAIGYINSQLASI